MRIVLFSLLTFLTTCRIEKKIPDEVVARVNDQYLYMSEIATNLGENLTSADSATVVHNYINNWAKERLLLDKAVFNLTVAQQENLESLVRLYRNDLFIKNYQEEWLKARVDTLVTNAEIESYFEANKQNFKLHQDFMRGRYVQLPLANFNSTNVRKAIRRFNNDDRVYLDSINLQFKSALLNDSIWYRPQTFFRRINLPNPNDYSRYLKNNRFFEIEDSLDLYLVFVEEVRYRNEVAPIANMRPTLKQIILNKRKLDMLRDFDRDILEEAAKENIFERYE